MNQGHFLTFEGGEGAGKSTQVTLLAERLRAEGERVVVTREPGGSPFAEALRELLLNSETPPHDALSEALVFYAARADHLNKTIRPALADGQWVLCDRFSDSTRVYQSLASTLSPDVCDRLDELVVGETQPAMTILLDIKPEDGLARANRRREADTGDATSAKSKTAPADRYEGRTLAYHQRLRDGFLELAASSPERFVVVDAAQPIDIIAADIWTALKTRLMQEAI